MNVPSLVTLVPLKLDAATVLNVTASPSGSLQPATVFKSDMAIFHVNPLVTLFVTIFATTGAAFGTTKLTWLEPSSTMEAG